MTEAITTLRKDCESLRDQADKLLVRAFGGRVPRASSNGRSHSKALDKSLIEGARRREQLRKESGRVLGDLEWMVGDLKSAATSKEELAAIDELMGVLKKAYLQWAAATKGPTL